MGAFKTNKLAPSAQKLRGGYYTPPLLAEFLVDWAVRSKGDKVLEPSCGDGNFTAILNQRLGAGGSITAVELQEQEMLSAQRRSKKAGADQFWLLGDFFERFDELKAAAPYDAIVGNPPFIRFQHFEVAARNRAFEHLRHFGYRPNGLANAWCAFIQLCAELVAPEGRMAFVVPAELLQVGYAQELRDRLPRMFRETVLVAFQELVFPEIQQEVVLLLAEGRKARDAVASALHVVQVKNGVDLLHSGLLDESVEQLPARHSRAGMKWTSLFLESENFDVLSDVQKRADVRPLSAFASVDVGVVTGRNSFFVVSPDDADDIGVNGFAVPSVGRTSALKSIRFTGADLEQFESANPARMLNLKGVERARFSSQLERYIAAGEKEGVHQGYKCRMRSRWFDVPSIYVPDAFMFRQIHHAPFLVANHASATSTDTIHRVRIRLGIDRDRLCASSINSLSFAWAEVCGRSYGGGVLELEPREAEELPCLYDFGENLDHCFIDECLRRGQIDRALEHTDQVLLRDGLGLSVSEVSKLNSAWVKLRHRRQGRRHSA